MENSGGKRYTKPREKSYQETEADMKKKYGSLLCAILALILMALPFSMTLTFATGPDNKIRKAFSYFDLTAVGYANPFPLLTAALCIAGIAFLLSSIYRKRRRKPALACLASAALAAAICLFFSGVPNGWEIAVFFLLAGSVLLLLEENAGGKTKKSP